MQHGNSDIQFIEQLGEGKEGVIHKVLHNNVEKVFKQLTPRGKRYFPLIKEYVKRTASIDLTHWYHLEIVEDVGFMYPYEQLIPIENYKQRMGDELSVVQELFEKTRIHYADFGFERNNIMQTQDGDLRIVDYGSGFLYLEEEWMNFHDRYHTFFFRPDYYKKLFCCWILFHRYGLIQYTKGFTTKNNFPIIKEFINWKLYRKLLSFNTQLAKLVYSETLFDNTFYATLKKLLL